MATKRGAKSTKRGKTAKNLPVRNVTARKAKGIKGGAFAVENPTTIGSATGGAGAGKINFNELK